jgi:hypothetical protein
LLQVMDLILRFLIERADSQIESGPFHLASSSSSRMRRSAVRPDLSRVPGKAISND